MNQDRNYNSPIYAQFIETFEIDHEIASNCQFRSNLVHEKILKARTKEAANSVILLICDKGVRVIRSSDQVVLSSHSIKRVSYSACDRVNGLFALVVRSDEINRCQTCFIFKMHTSEQAESINRYFGTIFKELNEKRKERKLKLILNDGDKAGDNVGSCDLDSAQIDGLDDSLEKSNHIRRLSLSMPNAECANNDDNVDTEVDQLQPLYSSLEKRTADMALDNCPRQFLRRKRPEYKSNRISAVIERLSFRSTKEIASDFLKSGSPVVALKEQLEYEELCSSTGSSVGAESVPSQPRKVPVPPASGLCLSNDSRAQQCTSAQLSRKNSAPSCAILCVGEEETAPVPPVRIHSLRCATLPPSQSVPCHGAMPPQYDDEDDDDDDSSSSNDLHRGQRLATVNACSEAAQSPSSSCPVAVGPRMQAELPSRHFKDLSKEEALACLLGREVGSFLLRQSGSHRECLALSVKVADQAVSHYLVAHPPSGGPYRLKGMDRAWPDLESLLHHLSVAPEILPCPLRLRPRHQNHNDVALAPDVVAGARYQQLSECSTLVDL